MTLDNGRYVVKAFDWGLLLVDQGPPARTIADFGVSDLPAPLTAAVAQRCARVPEMTGLLIDAARFFRDHGKARRKAGDLPGAIMAVLRDLELDGWAL